MNYMECTTCKAIVQQNNTGTCLSCQGGFIGVPGEDSYEYQANTVKKVAEKENTAKLNELMARKKEIEDALQVGSTEKVDVCEQAKDGKRVASGNAKKRKTPKKKGKIKEKG